MERGVHLPGETERAQAGLSGVRREPADAGRFSRDGGASAVAAAEGIRRRGCSGANQKLSAAAPKVSGVCLSSFDLFYVILLHTNLVLLVFRFYFF